jgi:hypothetical protein
MNRTPRNAGLLISVAYAIVLVILSFSYLATSPWHAIPELGGDGMKNTFVYISHSIYGKGYWFEGMNYPYGEHIVYTDGMPFLTVILSHIPGITPPVAMAVLWWLISLSYVVAVAYVYKILAHYKVNVWIAILFAGLIVFFSPQFFRARSHYGLSFACVIPMLFYWTIQYMESSRIKYCVYIFILGSIFTFMHPYHAGLFMIWVGCYTLGLLFFHKSTLKEKLRHLFPLYGSVIAILLLVALVMKATDPLTDRPAVPYSSPDYFTHLRQLLISANSPFWQFAQKHGFIYSANTDGEGYAYAGIACLAVVGLAILLFCLRKIKIDRTDKTPTLTGFPVLWLFAAFCVLILSMGGPMLISPKAINYLSFFKQFRSLGRFSWAYYYIIAIYAVVAINYAFSGLKAKGKPALAYAILLATFGLWAFEASGYIRYSRGFSESARYNYDMIFSAKEKNWKEFLNEHGYKGNDFQAVIILPYFHTGTDKLWVGDPGWEMALSSKACLQLQLPMTDVLMSRTSWSQTEKQVKLAGGPFAKKDMLGDLKSAKPFLVMYFDEIPLSPDERNLLMSSDYLGDFSQCKIYAAYPARILASDKKTADSVAAILPNIQPGDTCIGCNGTYYVDHLDRQSTQQLFGHGALPYDNNNSGTLIPVTPAGDQLYECSAWFLLSKKDYRSPDIVLQLLDAEKKPIKTEAVRTLQSVDNNGMWFRAAVYFTLPSNCRYINWNLENNGEPSYLVMDELQLRPADALIISKSEDGKVMVNNHLFVK